MANLTRVYEVLGPKEVANMKVQLRHQIDYLVAKEKRFCERKKCPPMMDDAKRAKIEKLIKQCYTPWHCEALRKIIFFFNLIPTFREVEIYAFGMRDAALGKDPKSPSADA